MSGSLFDLGPGKEKDGKTPAADRQTPLAERVRPTRLDEVIGLEEILGAETFLGRAIEEDRVPSIIFWGPPGSGKTTIARLIARLTQSRFVPYSAATSGIKEARSIMADARKLRQKTGERTTLFVDEIHRFNRAQQDAFLPYVEAGDIVLIGATTENPSFEVNSALLSRCRVVVLPQLSTGSISRILRDAIERDPYLGEKRVNVEQEALDLIATLAAGDARQALGMLETLVATSESGGSVDASRASEIIRRRSLRYDKGGEYHYDLISAVHKSIRNSDPDASVYWLARMLEGGEDPMYLARRLVRAASEDIGLADSNALKLAIAVRDTVHFLGMPEAGVALAQLAIYLAQAPKSNSAYVAWGRALEAVRSGDDPPVPMQIRNAPTGLMKKLGYGEGYEYAHSREEGVTAMPCLPDELADAVFYEPRVAGEEEAIAERLEKIRKLRDRLAKTAQKKNTE